MIYNAAVSACGKGQQWRIAVALFAEMGSLWIQQSTISFSATISACEKGE